MDETEFDKFAEEYQALHKSNIKASGESPDFFSEYKIKDVCHIVSELNYSENLKIIDFGSGVGNSVPFINKHMPNAQLTCLDVSSKSLDIARSRYRDYAEYVSFDGESIPFEDEFCDVVFSACVFHHIPNDEHEKLLREIYRILKPGGMFIVFEHNPFNPLTRNAVNTCPFDENAVLITAPQFVKRIKNVGYKNIERHYRIFFPRFFRLFRKMEKFLTWFPLGAQYYVLARKM
jgi:ubiquinone/menaquinone biosynthesis C-methylase UbiE